MYVRITFVFLIVSMIGCGALKERFGTVEETPELESARTECRFLADKDTSAKNQGIFKKMDSTRAVYDDCMKNKGYSKGGRKVN